MNEPRLKTPTGAAAARTLPITPPQILGPFYPVSARADPDTGPAHSGDIGTAAQGELIEVRGRVLDRFGKPVSKARIDIWQANAAGKYRHPSDSNPAPLDRNFHGFARLVTDACGRYHFRTIKPGGYPTAEGEMRPPHIHLDVEGRFDRLVTQLYFAGEPDNQTDRWLNAAPHPELLIVTLQSCPSRSDTRAPTANFDIVLATG
jgi:protocatechuate 3,4-dioxygenase, beta subunit